MHAEIDVQVRSTGLFDHAMHNHLGFVTQIAQRDKLQGLVAVLRDGTQIVIQQQVAEFIGEGLSL